MRFFDISYKDIFDLVRESSTTISADVRALMRQAAQRETNSSARVMLEAMLSNVALAEREDKAVCQSPGFPTVYVRFGDGIDLGDLINLISDAVVECTEQGYFRPSIVHPLTRQNSGNNSGIGVPNIEYRHTSGQEFLEIIMSAKGCGAELANVSTVLTPATLGKNFSGLKTLVLQTVSKGGGIPCPPTAIGIGIGGQMDVSAKLSREAVSTRDWRDENSDPVLQILEKELLSKINMLGIGPAGIGGDTTCLAVKIAAASTHTAICPVTVNFHCWIARRFGVRFYKDGRREQLFREENNYACA